MSAQVLIRNMIFTHSSGSFLSLISSVSPESCSWWWICCVRTYLFSARKKHLRWDQSVWQHSKLLLPICCNDSGAGYCDNMQTSSNAFIWQSCLSNCGWQVHCLLANNISELEASCHACCHRSGILGKKRLSVASSLPTHCRVTSTPQSLRAVYASVSCRHP